MIDIKTKDERKIEKALQLLEQHEIPLIKEMGASAFEKLSPRQVARELGIETTRIGDLVRQGWLASVPGEEIGTAHLYYRWRVEFVKRYKRVYEHSEKYKNKKGEKI